MTDFDLRAALQRWADVLSSSIRWIMNPHPVTLPLDVPVARAMPIIKDRRNPFNVLPVVERGRPVGRVQIHDLRARGL